MTALYIVLGLLAIIIIYMIINAMTGKPIEIQNSNIELITVDKDKVAKHLGQAIQCATVSLSGTSTDEKPFDEFKLFIDKTYPLFTKKATKTIIHTHSLVYFLEGSDKSLKPACFLSHQDVVPAPPKGWEVPPFSGVIKEGFIYGRGAQDMKSQLVATLEGIEALLESGFAPRRGIYCCFGHDEEVTTKVGAPNIVKYLQEQGVELEFVFDEGGAVLDGALLGIKGKQLAMIGTCEKGYADIKLTAKVNGGHASMPGKKTSISVLAKAIDKLLSNPMSPVWTQVSKDMFDSLAPSMSPVFKFVLSNRKILSGVIKNGLTLIPITNSLFRTTFAPTMLTGSDASNVMPPEASVIINSRIITGQTSEDVIKHMQKVVGKLVDIEIMSSNEPTPISPVETDTYNVLRTSIMESFADTIVSPFLFIAGTDARYYTSICKNVYRFTPFAFTQEDSERIHALNERISVDNLAQGVKFFARFIENICA